jgi:protein-disulfide isomerase
LEEFGDFQCPPCAALSEPLNQLSHDFPQLRIVFRNFPLPNHKHAIEAARAAEAAGRQNKFWEMHDLLYREQATWATASAVPALFNDYALKIGCDVQQFQKEMDSQSIAEVIKADAEEGTRLGVKNTPTIFINNAMVAVPDLEPDHLRAAIESAFRAAEKSSAEKEGHPTR